jgi:hypothetical protein
LHVAAFIRKSLQDAAQEVLGGACHGALRLNSWLPRCCNAAFISSTLYFE